MSRKALIGFSLGMCACLLLYPAQTVASVKNGFIIWYSVLLPSLFPFFVCTSMLYDLNFLSSDSKAVNFFARITGVPAQGIFIYIISCFSGAPTGSRLCGMMQKSGVLSDAQSDIIASICNMPSPVFVSGAVCVVMFNSPELAFPMIASIALSALIMLIFCFIFSKTKVQIPSQLKPQEQKNTIAVFTDAVWQGILGMLKILGMLLFFSAIITVLEQTGVLSLAYYPISAVLSLLGIPEEASGAIAKGMLEMTLGCGSLAQVSMGKGVLAALATFCLTFGGICILGQSMAFCRLNALKYIAIKLLHALMASLICFGLCLLFLPDASSVFSNGSQALYTNAFSGIAILFASLFSVSVIIMLATLKSKRAR